MWATIMNQNTKILNYIQSTGSITPMEALILCNCFRLAARIYDLKQAGNDIHTQIINKNDKMYASYYLS